MGLDMYLLGEKFYWTDLENDENNLKEDGFRVESKELRLGYWRKHPNLHGYIVQAFTDGVDNCQRIELSIDDLNQILNAVKNQNLPETTGFFFGQSDSADEQDTLLQLEKAIEWAKAKEPNVSRSVVYQASW